MVVPSRCQRLDPGEQRVGLRCREHGGRLVEDQDFRRGDQRLGDLDDLLLRDAQRPRPARADRCWGIRNRASTRAGDAVGRRPVDDERQCSRRHAAEQHVLGDAQMRQQAELLIDGADAERHGVGRPVDPRRLAVEQDVAAVRMRGARQHLHQRRLAGAVLAADRQHASLADRERDVADGRVAVVALGDAADREMRHQPAAPNTSCSSSVFSLVISCSVSWMPSRPLPLPLLPPNGSVSTRTAVV